MSTGRESRQAHAKRTAPEQEKSSSWRRTQAGTGREKRAMSGKPAGNEWVATGDGSVTLFSREYGEHYHSLTGAIEECREKFVKPLFSELRLGGAKKLRVLDVGFGLGLNSACLIEECARRGLSLEIVALEKDRGVAETIKRAPYPFEAYRVMRKLLHDSELVWQGLEFSLSVLWGHALEMIDSAEGLFHGAFLDAFSPKVNPEMWSLPFISRISSLCQKGGVLCTFSCARKVKENMRKAGFAVRDGPRVGRRGPSTVAVKL